MIELTLDNFDEEITNCEQPVLIDWWGETCESCLALMPTITALAETYGDKLKFTKFNTSQKGVRRFCIKHKIMGLPVISIYQQGEKVAELGKEEISKESLEEMIKKYS
ncbi:thioredoxin TrxA [uncultured Vagococcus sp.]|uniref:thioredoxin TrxA n=1 Tax=uncultured Vagococcus sp. TaxID=189676 RepID=UPI0028D751CB|nr:thioredoxin domain-containing protein [uncultured Vagococcus sp.]